MIRIIGQHKKIEVLEFPSQQRRSHRSLVIHCLLHDMKISKRQKEHHKKNNLYFFRLVIKVIQLKTADYLPTTTRDKIVETFSSNGVTLENKTIHSAPTSPPFKVDVFVIFYIRWLEQQHNIAWLGWGRERGPLGRSVSTYFVAD